MCDYSIIHLCSCVPGKPCGSREQSLNFFFSFFFHEKTRYRIPVQYNISDRYTCAASREIINLFLELARRHGGGRSRTEVRWRLPAGVPLALEYTHVGHAKRSIA